MAGLSLQLRIATRIQSRIVRINLLGWKKQQKVAKYAIEDTPMFLTVRYSVTSSIGTQLPRLLSSKANLPSVIAATCTRSGVQVHPAGAARLSTLPTWSPRPARWLPWDPLLL